MNVQVERLEHNMAKLTITVDAAAFDKAITQAYKKMKNQISIPGFRKGKVPQAMVEKMYGPAMFYEDAANIVIPDAYDEALAELKDLAITSQPDIEVTQMSKGKDFVFTAEVAIKPEVTLGQYKGIEVSETVVEVSDDEIDAEIKKVQEQNSREVSVDRAAESGDTVIIDYVGTVDGVEFEGGAAEDYALVLGSGSFIPGFEDQLVGAVAESEVEVNVTFPESYHEPSLAGKAAIFNVKVNDVTVKELPELDDDFAQDVSEADTFEEYKGIVKAELIEKKQDVAKEQKQEKIMAVIVDNCEMDIPQPMIDTQARQMLDQYSQQMRYSGLSMEQYYQFTGMTPETLLEQLKPQAEKNIQHRLVLETIAKAEGLEATEEEVNAEFEKMAAQYNMEIDQVKTFFADEQLETLKSDISAQKALAMITEAAVEVPVAEAEAVEAIVEE